MTSFCTIADVRAYLNVNTPSPDAPPSPLNSAIIGSNILIASEYLQRVSGRQFEAQTGVTKTFTSEGRAAILIPDLRAATSVSLQSAVLTSNQSYWLIPDPANDGIYIGLQFRQFSRFDYRANPQWFDRNLDSWLFQAKENNWGSLPNDLTITGDWGWSPIPMALWNATRVLAAWYSKRPDAVLSNVLQGPGGTVSDVSQMPPEVQQFIGAWSLRESVVAVG